MDSPSLSELSLKQLNHVLLAKLSTLSSSDATKLRGKRILVIDRESLVDLCKEYVSESEVSTLLNTDLDKTHTDTKKPPSSVDSDASELANCTPQQLLYRAECMRKHPEIVRASAPAMAKLSDKEIFAMADKMQALAENPEVPLPHHSRHHTNQLLHLCVRCDLICPNTCNPCLQTTSPT